MGENGYTDFGPDIPLNIIQKNDPDFYACIMESSLGRSTTRCDEIVGNIKSGLGACSTDKYKTNTYCACVNSPIANALCIFAPCANDPFAYRPTNQIETKFNNACPTQISCMQIEAVGGTNNVVNDVTQSQNCGGTENFIQRTLELSPTLLIIVILFSFLSVISIIVAFSKKSKNKTPTIKQTKSK
jgi:hypothetical protein